MIQRLNTKPASVCPANSASTRMARWQQRCWELAEAGLPFELRDIQTKHFMFCQWLRGEYNYTFIYKYHHGNSVATFTPENSLPPPECNMTQTARLNQANKQAPVVLKDTKGPS